MAKQRPLGMATGTLVVLVLMAAGGTRAWYVRVCADNGAAPGPLQVQDPRGEELDALARNVSAGRGYVSTNGAEKRAAPAPLYPWLLGQFLAVFPDVPAAHQAVRWAQCLLGAWTAGLLFLFALRAFSSVAVATLAGLFAACDPFWIVNTPAIDDGVLATFLLAACLFLGVRAGQEGGAFTSWLYGLALACLALTRAALVPFALVALLWFLRRCRVLERGWLAAATAFLGFVSALAPWQVRNFQLFGDVYPIVDSTYFHLWLGNHPGATGGPMPDLPPDESHPTDAQRAAIILDEVRGNPAGTLARRLWAGLYFFFGENWFRHGILWSDGDTDWEGLPDWLERAHAAILYGALLGLLVLGVLGWRWSHDWHEEALPSLAVVWIPLPYVLSHAEALQGPRLPLDCVLICYAAYALVCLVTFKRK